MNFAVNANGVLHAEYGSRRMYRSYFTEAERVGFECHAEVHENDWTAELKVPVKILEKIYGPLNLGEGSYFTCNFIKFQSQKKPNIMHLIPLSYRVCRVSMYRNFLPTLRLSDRNEKEINYAEQSALVQNPKRDRKRRETK